MGPFLPIATFRDADEAIKLANSTRYGLSAYVWTNDMRTAIRAAERLEFGLIGVNEWSPQSTEVPFPGWKESGIGKEGGAEGLDEYLETKVIAMGGFLAASFLVIRLCRKECKLCADLLQWSTCFSDRWGKGHVAGFQTDHVPSFRLNGGAPFEHNRCLIGIECPVK